MDVESAFKAGLALVREAGLPARSGDIQVLAAYSVFVKAARGLEADPRFRTDGPVYAKRLILVAYSKG
jgi:hypothetical protein